MQEVRNASNLLNGVFDDGTDLGHLLGQLIGAAFEQHDAVRHHFRDAQLLPQSIVQLARDTAPLFVLGNDEPAGKFAQLGVQRLQLLRFPVELREYAHLGAQQFGVYRN